LVELIMAAVDIADGCGEFIGSASSSEATAMK
jgi:hypothetical protein